MLLNHRFRLLDRSRMAPAQFGLLALVLAALVPATPGVAAPLYEVDLEAAVESQDAFDNTMPSVSGSGMVSLSELRNIPGATAFASGAAGPGSVAVIGTGFYSVLDPNFQTSGQGEATAIATGDDVIFSGTGTLNGLMLKMDLSGSMSVFGTTDVATTSLSVSFTLNNQTVNGFRTVQLPFFFFDDGVLDGVWSQGLASFNGSFFVGPFNNVPTNTPLVLRKAITIESGAFIFPTSVIGNAARASGDLGSTLSFTRSGPVFSTTDPDFVTVNSAQLNIVDGLWTGSPVSATPIPTDVPIPPPWGLAVGMTGAGYWNLRKRQFASGLAA